MVRNLLFRLFVLLILGCLSPVLVRTQQIEQRIDWQGDLQFLENELPKSHLKPFHALSERQFHRMVRELAASSSGKTDRQMVAGLMKITSAIGDSHSGIHSIPANLRFSIVPISLYLFSDGLGVVATDPANREILGGKVISINGHPSNEVVRRMKLLTEGTNDFTRSAFVVHRLIRPELLYYEGLGRTPDEYEIVVQKDGRTITRKLAMLGRKPDGAPLTGGLSILPLPAADSDWLSAAPQQRPLWLQHLDKFFWYQEIPEHDALYVKDALVLNPNEGQTFAAFFNEVFQKLAEGKYKKAILDLRLNGGGDNTLFEPLKASFKSNPMFQSKGSFFVITGRLTQSAAQNFTTFLERNTKAIFVGEPTGERPNHYGDAEPITLPSSHIEINLSRKYWQDSDPGDPRLYTAPAIAAPLTLRDFREGRDPALEAVWRSSQHTIKRRLSIGQRKSIGSNDK